MALFNLELRRQGFMAKTPLIEITVVENLQTTKNVITKQYKNFIIGHPHRVRRSATTLSLTIGYYKDISPIEKEEFETEFGEFIWKTLPKFNLAFVEIPEIMEEDLISEIRTKSFVRMVEHVVMRYESENKKKKGSKDKKMFWNLATVTNSTSESRQNQVFGTGFRVQIYVIDSGVDDHVEFGSRINRKLSKSFRTQKDPYGDNNDTFDCRGHGTAV
eukprot:Awhi_evm3s7813